MPPENVATGESLRSHRPTIVSTCSIRGVDEVRLHSVELGVELQVLLGGQVAVERRVLEHEPDVAAHVVALAHDVVAGDAWPSRPSAWRACRAC